MTDSQCPTCQETLRRDDLDSDYPRCPACGSDITSFTADTDVAPSPPAERKNHAPGTTIQQLNIPGYGNFRRIGSGGMGDVWIGDFLKLNQPRALKVLSPQLAEDEHFLARFDQEARILAQLSHKHIVRIYDYDLMSDDHPPFISMGLVTGPDGEPSRGLQSLISEGQLTADDTRRIALQIVDALRYAHDLGVVHRDIKPGNVLIDSAGDVQLVDFGIAAQGAQEERHLTVTGVAMGTRAYMAPEQTKDAKSIDGRADLYSLGVMLYEMLTGERPSGAFEAPSKLVDQLPGAWDDVVMKALRPAPEQRFANAAEMAEAIKAIGSSPVHLPPGAAAGAPASDFTTPDGVCFSCRAPTRPESTFCVECGESLTTECPTCNAAARGGGKFCEGCGYDLSRWRKAEKQTRDGLEALARAAADTATDDDRLAHAEKAATLLLRAAKEQPMAERIGQELHEAKSVYCKCAFAAGGRAEKSMEYQSARDFYQSILEFFPDTPEPRERLEAIGRIRDELLRKVSKSIKDRDARAAGAIAAKLAEQFSEDPAVASAIEEARALASQSSELRGVCERLTSEKKLYELQALLSRHSSSGGLDKQYASLREQVERSIGQLAPAIDAAEQFLAEGEHELAHTQAKRVLEIAADCPAALSVIDVALAAMRKPDVGGGRGSKTKMALVALVLAAAAAAAWATQDQWRPLLTKQEPPSGGNSNSGNTTPPPAPDPNSNPQTSGTNKTPQNTAGSANQRIASGGQPPRGGFGAPQSSPQQPVQGQPAPSKEQTLALECRDAIVADDITLAETKLAELEAEYPGAAMLPHLRRELGQKAVLKHVVSAENAIQRGDFDQAQRDYDAAAKYNPTQSAMSSRFRQVGARLASRPADLNLKIWVGDASAREPVEVNSELQVVVDGAKTDWTRGTDNAVDVSIPPGAHNVVVRHSGRAGEVDVTVAAGQELSTDLYLPAHAIEETKPFQLDLLTAEQGGLPRDWTGSPGMKVDWPTGLRVLRPGLKHQFAQSPPLEIAGDFYVNLELLPMRRSGHPVTLVLEGAPGYEDLALTLVPTYSWRIQAFRRDGSGGPLPTPPRRGQIVGVNLGSHNGPNCREGWPAMARLERKGDNYTVLLYGQETTAFTFRSPELGVFDRVTIGFADENSHVLGFETGPLGGGPRHDRFAKPRLKANLTGDIRAPLGWTRSGIVSGGTQRLVSPTFNVGEDFLLAMRIRKSGRGKGSVKLNLLSDDGRNLPIHMYYRYGWVADLPNTGELTFPAREGQDNTIWFVRKNGICRLGMGKDQAKVLTTRLSKNAIFNRLQVDIFADNAGDVSIESLEVQPLPGTAATAP